MNVLITGANRGIGLGLANIYLSEGHAVAVTARKPEDAEAITALKQAHGSRVRVFGLDVNDQASVKAFAKDWGETPLDICINNAGVGGSFSTRLADLDFKEAIDIYNTNALGPMRLTQNLIPRLQRGSRVVNITSKMGSIADNNQGGSYFYRMSKAALNMATKCLALECEGAGIIVTAIHPGWVQTRMGGQSAPITVEQSTGHIVRTIEKLAAQHSGAFLNYDGAVIPW